MMRSILLTLFDPMHPDLDYLRIDPEAVARFRTAGKGGVT